MDIIKHITPRWKKVGCKLEIDSVNIELIDAGHLSDPEACCKDMIATWVRGKGKQPATWTTLVKVLKDEKFLALADYVEQLVSSFKAGYDSIYSY